MNKVCITITGKTSDEIIQKINQLSSEHDFFEIRLDGLLDLSESVITKIFEQTSNQKTIATIRTADEGGEFSRYEDYLKLIQACFSSKASFVDVELAMLNKYQQLAKLIDEVRTIISYHNFDQTPSESELKQVTSDMRTISEDAIVKIACMAEDMSDVNRLIELQRSLPKDKAIIVAMGEHGQILRLLGLAIGAFATFASADSSPVAPGQLYYKDMNKIVSLMENK